MKQILLVTALALSMRKFNLLLFILLAANFSFSQSKSADSLRQAIINASGEHKVMLLLAVNQVNFAWRGKDMVDSTYYYAKAAYDLSDKVGFVKGKAFAAKRLSEWATSWSRDCALALSYAKEAVKLAEGVRSDTLTAQVYFRLSGAVQCEDKEKNFGEAISALKKAAAACKAAGDKQAEGMAYWTICSMLSGKGKYEDGFDYCQNALELTTAAANEPKVKGSADEIWTYQLVEMSLLNIANLYVAAGDFETANDYMKQNKYYQTTHTPCCPMDDAEADLYIKMKQPDSALGILYKLPPKAKEKFWYKNYVGQALLLKKDYTGAIKLFIGALPEVKKDNKFHSYSKLLIDLGSAYAGIGNYKVALRYANDGVKEAELYDIRPYRLEAYRVLSIINREVNNNKTAYEYLDKYMKLKESILNNQFYWRLNNYKRAAEDEKKVGQINLLNKENQLNTSKLKQQAFEKKSLIAGLIVLLLLGIFIVRTLTLKRKNERLQLQKDLEVQKLQSEQKQTDLQRTAIELEMQALRAQMNPHFIFNCLSSINRFVLKNETEAASDYLTRFSRLIRMVLINSQKSAIPLEDEMEMLRLYLDMERLRFKESFDYNITYSNTVDAGAIMIPPLLLQPFCENAIWHGLMHKEGHGMLNIIIAMEKNVLHCTIADDGIGRKKAAELKSKSGEKEKSLGLKITTDRLALLNENRNIQTFYELHDLINENGEATGTKVDIKIKYKEEVTELV